MGIFDKKKQLNKFEGKRKYSNTQHNPRPGIEQSTLKRLEDFRELLDCDPDKEGYVITTFEEIMGLTDMDAVILSLMYKHGYLGRKSTGGSPKYKYKWKAGKPDRSMAKSVLRLKHEYEAERRAGKEGTEPTAEAEPAIAEDQLEPVSESTLIDHIVKDDILIIRVNTTMVDVDPKDIIKSVMRSIVD